MSDAKEAKTPEPEYTPQQAVANALELFGQPDWIVRLALRGSDYKESDFVAKSELQALITKRLKGKAKPEELPAEPLASITLTTPIAPAAKPPKAVS